MALRIGFATGIDPVRRDDWLVTLEHLSKRRDDVVELSVNHVRRLQPLLALVDAGRVGDFLRRCTYVSAHAPGRPQVSEATIVADLVRLPPAVQTIVVHPDAIGSVGALRALGERAAIENMDCTKQSGRTMDELASVFAHAPAAGLCFDVAHAWTVDMTLAAGHEILDEHADRLRQIHLSGIERDGNHRPLERRDIDAYAGLLARCTHVPWILESALADPALLEELRAAQFAR